MRRSLACTSLVFVMVLFLLQAGSILGVSGMYEENVLPSYRQGDMVVVCGQIADYSVDTRYGKTTTELNLKNVQILPRNEVYSKENRVSNHLSESDYFSKMKKIGTRRQRIIVYLQDDFLPVIGSYIFVSGEMSYFNKATNPGEFDAHQFYTNRGYLFAVKNASVFKRSESGNYILQGLKEFRLQQEKYLEEILPDGNAAIMKAMLFGNKKEMDDETKELYQKNGIAHILAISGLHISMLGMSVYKILQHLPIPKWCSLLISGVFLILYGFMVGISASAFRALVMFSFFLLSKWLKRSYDMITAMAFSALVWLMLYPGYLFDCGFQLSYAAIMGIGIVLPAMTKITDTIKLRWVRRIIALFLPSLSVNLMTAPILIYHYYELSFFSIVLNLIVIPLMAPLLISGIAMLAVANLYGNIHSIPMSLCAIPVNLILAIYEMGCRILEWFPIGRKNIAPLSVWGMVLYYSVIIAMTILVNKKEHIIQFVFPVVCILMLIIPKKPEFAVWMLDVGQGDSCVIFTNEGNCFVIDCGSTTVNNVGEKILIPFLKYYGVASVDGVIVSHPDADHMNGILQLVELGEEENIEIRGIYIYEKGLENEKQEWKELLSLAEENEINVYGMGQGDILQTKSFRMECLYPLQEQKGLTGNDSSLVICAETEDFFGLFTGDLEEEGERCLLTEYGGRENLFGKKECNILKIAHHGSSTSTSEKFLQWLKPKRAVISCGEKNRYGHPHKEVLERLKEENIPYWITYEEGALCVREE